MYVLKIIMLIAVFCTSTVIGILISKKYSNRLKILKELKNALSIFKVKINYSFETIPDVFKDISAKTKGTTSKIFEETVKNLNEKNMNAGEAWENAVEINGGDLKKEDISCLKDLGKLLGKTDVEGQIAQIDLVSQFIDKQISEATDEKNKNEKMYQKLGAIVGLVIVIVLV